MKKKEVVCDEGWFCLNKFSLITQNPKYDQKVIDICNLKKKGKLQSCGQRKIGARLKFRIPI